MKVPARFPVNFPPSLIDADLFPARAFILFFPGHGLMLGSKTLLWPGQNRTGNDGEFVAPVLLATRENLNLQVVTELVVICAWSIFVLVVQVCTTFENASATSAGAGPPWGGGGVDTLFVLCS